MSDTGDPDGHHAGRDPGHDEIGSLAEEAAKLFGAFQGWAREHAGDLGEGVSGLAGHAAAAASDVNEHLATGAAECTYCPICRTVHVVRSLSPEVRDHLAVAATSLGQAIAALMAPPTPAPSEDEVEHIDVDEDWTD